MMQVQRKGTEPKLSENFHPETQDLKLNIAHIFLWIWRQH